MVLTAILPLGPLLMISDTINAPSATAAMGRSMRYRCVPFSRGERYGQIRVHPSGVQKPNTPKRTAGQVEVGGLRVRSDMVVYGAERVARALLLEGGALGME